MHFAGNIFQLPPLFPMTQNASFHLALDAPASCYCGSKVRLF